MASLKKYDTYKSCIIRTPSQEFQEIFTTDWKFADIRSWMLDTFCIDECNIVEIEFSSVTRYKHTK